jgi:methyl-accepting chemotaxis protein
MDSLLLSVIKRAKEQVEKGEACATEYAKSLNEIFQKMNEFNGMTKEEFWKIVEQL